ncbi:methyltransferase domain-containing protein [Halobacillus shinanisalinarum]|uniref:Methyltransferase domain-containing protein n=1 Tax=Halobacillus shinanisalinarum TaxID=2932258 RepID=A0ABY4H1C6_9BACI|nr:class I SAM-dependent methyltransferase [Halobacillus shinanisalinarum]UOQ94193.1 methyltransferase domain-containing protein [Halobacillus shinanisalinarum]
MSDALTLGDTAIDGTCGNGHDTLLLSQLVGENGHVYGFDIQETAIQNTRQRLKDNHADKQTTLVLDSHSSIEQHIPDQHLTRLKAAIFNLGYLPGSDKSVITEADQTLKSVQTILHDLQKEGLIVLVVYYGHPGGEEEKTALLEYVSNLDQRQHNVLQYGFINQRNQPPFIIAIEKK